MAVANSVLRDGFYTGVPGEDIDAFVVNRATLGASTDVSDLVSFVEVGDDGDYDMLITPPAAGTLRMRWTTESGQVFTGTYDVLPAGADPAAIADAVAGIMDQSSTGYDAGTIGYEIHALFKRPVGSG